MAKKKSCVQCGAEFSAQRPYDHCTAQDCQSAWLTARRSRMAINLIPKSGFTPVFKGDEKSLARTTKG